MSRSIVLVVATVVLAAGCASTGDTRMSQAAPPARASTASIEQDTAYIDRVERQARARGIGLTWINPPVKRRTPR